MSLASWIALVISLLLLAIPGWLILTILWLTGHVAQRVASRTWTIRENFWRWFCWSVLIAIGVSLSGIWIVQRGNFPDGLLNDAQTSEYGKAMLAASIRMWVFALALMVIQIAWSYGCLVIGLLTGKYPVEEADSDA